MDRCPFIGPLTHGLGPRDFFQKNNSLLIKIPVTFAHRTLIFSNINPQSTTWNRNFIQAPRFSHSICRLSLTPPILHITPSLAPNCKSFPPEPLQFSKEAPRTFQIHIFALWTSFLHIFSTVTLNQVILVPKFSESHLVSLQAIYILLIVVFVWLYAWPLGEFILKPTNEDYKTKYMWIWRPSIWGLWSFLFKDMRQVSLMHVIRISCMYL
jgi:hypothetical protein